MKKDEILSSLQAGRRPADVDVAGLNQLRTQCAQALHTISTNCACAHKVRLCVFPRVLESYLFIFFILSRKNTMMSAKGDEANVLASFVVYFSVRVFKNAVLQLLWPYLFEFVCVEKYSAVVADLCKVRACAFCDLRFGGIRRTTFEICHFSASGR